MPDSKTKGKIPNLHGTLSFKESPSIIQRIKRNYFSNILMPIPWLVFLVNYQYQKIIVLKFLMTRYVPRTTDVYLRWSFSQLSHSINSFSFKRWSQKLWIDCFSDDRSACRHQWLRSYEQYLQNFLHPTRASKGRLSGQKASSFDFLDTMIAIYNMRW